MLRLSNYWYIACPSGELKQKPRRFEVEGETLVLFRNSKGEPHALVDRCAHRGMALSEGRVVGDSVECPYHGWCFSGKGRLEKLPALCEGEKLPQTKTMRSFPVAEQDDHVWVWIGSEAPDRPPFRFPHAADPEWDTFFMHTRFEAPVEACLENFLDVPHTIFVHPGLFRSGELNPTQVRVHRTGDSVSAEFLNEAPLTGIGPRLLFPKGTRVRHIDRFILPSITRVDYEFGPEHGFIITSQCTQRSEHVVDVTTAITWRLPRPASLAGPLLRPFLRWYCQRVIQQDVDVLAVIGKQIERFGTSHMHTEADLLGRHIERMRRRAIEGATTPEKVEELTLRI